MQFLSDNGIDRNSDFIDINIKIMQIYNFFSCRTKIIGRNNGG